MKPLWLLGGDVDGSASPAMYNAGLSALALPASYLARSVAPAALDAVLDEAEAEARGINVTLPFKVRVAERYARALDDVAARAGAVNTVVYGDDGAVHATNTDVHGLAEGWRRASVPVVGRPCAVVGAGGAARAAVVALLGGGAERVVVYARRREAADALVRLARELGGRAERGDDEPKSTLAIFATPALDDAHAWLRRTLAGPGTVHDLRYGGRGSALRNAALVAGHLYVDGSSMLLAQARLALAAFLGQPLPDAAARAMERTLAQALAHSRS